MEHEGKTLTGILTSKDGLKLLLAFDDGRYTVYHLNGYNGKIGNYSFDDFDTSELVNAGLKRVEPLIDELVELRAKVEQLEDQLNAIVLS